MGVYALKQLNNEISGFTMGLLFYSMKSFFSCQMVIPQVTTLVKQAGTIHKAFHFTLFSQSMFVPEIMWRVTSE